MGKPSGRGKKKNAGVGVDFKKVKHKVGKKLPRAQNQTDTSFKSRTISLAEQSLAADKGGQAVTGRNLTLKELLGQCGHYAERVRRDALAGLAELLAAHPEELRRHATLVMETAAERVADGEASVRAALRDLLSSTLLPALGPGALAPYVPLLMAHVCAAMTHLAEPIRADALGCLELLMGARPDLVAAGFLAPVLQHFGDLLSKGARGRSIQAGSLASLHGVAAALERFLAGAVAALRPGGGGEGSAGQRRQQQQQQREQAQEEGAEEEEGEQPAVLAWRRCQWPPADGGSGGSGRGSAGTPQQRSAGSAGESAAGGSGGPADAAQAAAAALLGHLLDCWAEAGPSQLAEVPELVAAQSLTAILRSCDLLLRHWGAPALAGSPADRASLAAALVKRVAPHFPVQRPAVKAAPAVVDQLVQLNVAAAQLLAHFLPRAAATAADPELEAPGLVGRGGAAGAAGAAAAAAGGSWDLPWVGRLLDWFAGVMAQGAALPASDDALCGEAPEPAAEGPAGSGKKRQRSSGGNGGSDGGSRATLPAEVYQSALDGALGVLPLLPPARRAQLLGAAWQLWQRTPARSGARARVLAFWQALLADPAAAFYVPTPGGGPLLQHAEVAAWLGALPRYLFELGGGNPAASRAALRLLLGAARCAPPGSPLAAALQELQPQLAPLWAVVLPPGKQAAAAGGGGVPRVHVGSLGSLPLDVQELAADLLYHFPAASEQVLRAAAVACLHDGAYPASTAARLLGVLGSKAAAGAADPAAFCGLLLNVLAGASRAGLCQRSWQRHAALVAAACQAALALGGPAEVGAALLPPLLGCCGSSLSGGDASSGADGDSGPLFSPWAAFGLLQLCATLGAAAAAAQQEWEPPGAVAAQLPGLMLRLQAASQPQAAAASGDGQALTAADVCALCLRLIMLLPEVLLLGLLAAVPASLAAQPAAADACAQLLPAALALLAALLKEQALRAALLEQQPALEAALAACRAASEASGSAMQAAREWQKQLRQLEATCAAVLGGGAAGD